MEFTRQEHLFNPEDQNHKIVIIGAGSTGSFIALTLAKMGFDDLTIIDYDKIEAHNIPNQFFREEDKEEYKVAALCKQIYDFTGAYVLPITDKITEDYEFSDIMSLDTIFVVCVDNIKARKIILEKLKDFPVKLVDTRMGGEGFSIHVIDFNDASEDEIKQYSDGLNKPVKETPCGEKAIIYTVLAIASETCNIIKRLDKGESYPKILRREMKTYRFISDLE